MDYCTEIASTMKQDHSLGTEIDARREANRRDREYWRLVGKQRVLERRVCDLYRQAAQEFAALNGWRWVERHFLARTLARGGTHEGRHDGGGSWGLGGDRDETMDGEISYYLFDHPLFFRELARPYRAAAIVGQPYGTDIADARVMAAKIGLVLHVPPNLTASWWYPGWTRFFCFTRPTVACVRIPARADGSDEREVMRKVMFTREEAEKVASIKDIGIMASAQIRQALTRAGEAGISDATRDACLRALPAIERKIESLCPAVLSATERGVTTAYGPLLEYPQATLCVLANSRCDCFTVRALLKDSPPVHYSEEQWVQTMTKPECRAAGWNEFDKALRREDVRGALAIVRALTGPAGWEQLKTAVQAVADNGLQPVVWVVAAGWAVAGGEKAGGALGVLALPPAINLASCA